MAIAVGACLIWWFLIEIARKAAEVAVSPARPSTPILAYTRKATKVLPGRVGMVTCKHEGAAINAADPLQPVQAADPAEAEIGEVYCGQTRRGALLNN